jgi:hypothetical protein
VALEKVNELAEMFNRMLAPSRAMEWRPDASIPDYPASAEVAEAAEEAAEMSAEAHAAGLRAKELLEEMLDEQRRRARRQRWTVAISLAIAAASLAVSIVVAVVKQQERYGREEAVTKVLATIALGAASLGLFAQPTPAWGTAAPT